LIEKVRSVVTDGTGQYRIENLRPGTYAVTFTLPGFATVRREGIELTGAFVATVNADLRVGALEETITVTGETPVVDVQSTTRQTVLGEEVLDLLPTGRATTVLAQLIPAVVSTRDDVGGLDSLGRTSPGAYGVADTRMFVGGIGVQSGFGGGATGTFNVGSYEEVAVDTGGISAESKEGGVRINLVPRYGSNTFQGSLFGAFANSDMQGTNLTQELRDRGLPAGDSLKTYWDVNPSYGGPIMRDRVWFYGSARNAGILRYVPVFYNRNAGNPNAWTYEADTSRPPETFDDLLQNAVARLSWQATPRNKIDFAYDYTRRCECPRTAPGPTISPETASQDDSRTRPKRILFGNWTSPITNRLLFEAGTLHHYTLTLRPGIGNPNMNAVTEQSTGLRYRAALATFIARDAETAVFQGRAALSYITGAHALKVGFNFTNITAEEFSYSIDAPMDFRFNNGVPNRLTMAATPYIVANDVDADNGLFIQDRWTVNRLTVTGGLRYDYFRTSFPDTTIGPAQFAPNRNITIPGDVGVRWHDLSPRSGVAYDLFGDGRTAVKASLNKYLTALVTRGIFGHLMAPANRLVTRTNRSWNDANANYVPDCNLLNPAANGECGAMDNLAFGTVQTSVTYDPDTLSGWGVRGGEEAGDPGHYWQFSTGVQREIMPRVSVDFSYFRTWYGGFIVNDNRAVGPEDFEEFRITAPVDPRLPGGGGYAVSGLYDIRPAKFGVASDDYLTFADNYGKQTRHWNGFDVTISARPRGGLMFQGGTSTGRQSSDNCEVLAKLPENDPLGRPYCRQKEDFQTTLKFVSTYTVPRIDVQVSGTYQDLPGRPILADYVATNAEIVPSLGRNLAGGARNVTVGLVTPGTMFGDRVHQLDLRFGKILRFGRTRTTASLDLYNVLNVNPVRAYSAAYATWQRPQGILSPRFAKVVLQFEF
jgi:hypothetical protein